jgi:hypothetical protein
MNSERLAVQVHPSRRRNRSWGFLPRLQHSNPPKSTENPQYGKDTKDTKTETGFMASIFVILVLFCSIQKSGPATASLTPRDPDLLFFEVVPAVFVSILQCGFG